MVHLGPRKVHLSGNDYIYFYFQSRRLKETHKRKNVWHCCVIISIILACFRELRFAMGCSCKTTQRKADLKIHPA